VALGISRQVLKRALSSPTFFSRTLPAALLALLLLTGFVTIITQVGKYGIAEDELTQDGYGRAALAFYATFGRNKTFVTGFGAEVSMADHGVIFDVVVAAAQYVTPFTYHWQVRHLMTALVGVIGVAIIALAGYELGGYWVAFLAGLGLWLYPRYYGSIYTNPKDVPAAITWALTLWAALVLIRRWDTPDRPQQYLQRSALLGFCIGLATAVRVYGLIWYAVLGVILAGWWLFHGRQAWREGYARSELLKQAKAAALIGIVSYGTMIVLWPYLILNPVGNLYDAVVMSARYPWKGAVLYKGTYYLATQLPLDYIVVWLIIGSTLTCLALATLGLLVTGVSWGRARTIDPKTSLVLLTFIVPFTALMGLHPVLYDGLRHFLFLILPLILLGAYGLVRVLAWLARQERMAFRVAAAGMVAITMLSYAFDVKDMLALSPFEYSYFSPLIGGIAGAAGKYDMEYWSTCDKQAAEWLGANYRRYTSSTTPSVEGKSVQSLVMTYLPSNFREDQQQPDFYVSSTRLAYDQRHPDYSVIHLITADDVPVCVVKVNPAIAVR
jgi:hypothetical protein